MRYVFADYELDTRLYELRHAGQPCQLEPQVFNVLLYLIEHRDQVVTKDELLEQLWPQQFISEVTLNHRVMTARKAIGDSGREQRCIKTFHRRGYRFIAPVVEHPAVVPGATETLPLPTPDLPQPPETDARPVALAPAVAERRHLTVLCCDLVGSTALAGRLDPEEYREVVRAYHQTCAAVVQRFDGTIAQYLGDGVLVYFGYPMAHEDDALRAVQAGLALLEARVALTTHPTLPPGESVALRLGVHTGLVVVDEVGAGPRHEPLALGETPNVALRLPALAASNTLVLSAATHQLVAGYVRCKAVGAHTLQGLAQPLEVYHVLGTSGVHSRLAVAALHGLTPLVGRAQEVALLTARWTHVIEGMGQVVLLTGEAGIGKSRLAQVLIEHVADTGHVWLECQGSPYYQHTALYPLIELLERTVLGFDREEPPPQKLAKLEACVQCYGLPLAEVVPLLAALLALPLPAAYAPLVMSPEQQKQHTLHALLTLLLRMAAQQPLLLVIEDLQWVDPSTLEWLSLLVDQGPTTGLLALCTYRSEFSPPWMGRTHLTQVMLARLPQAQTTVLTQQVAHGKALPTEVAVQIVAKTDGVPLFVEEVTKTVLESGLIQEQDDHYSLTGPLPPLAIPVTLHDSLLARLDRQGAAKGLAQLGATVGREFSYALLQAVSPWDAGTLERGLQQLVAAEFLYQQGLPPQASYRFKHALIQDTAYQSLLRSTRQQYHQRIAQVLETRFPESCETQPELLAYHYTEAGLTEQAIVYWQRAGQQASERSANLEAISHFTRGIELLTTLPETPAHTQQTLTLLIALGAALQMVKGFAAPEVERTYTRARDLCQQMGETSQLVPVLFGLWRYYQTRSPLRTALNLGETLLGLTQHTQDPALMVIAHSAVGTTCLWLGALPVARAHIEESIAHSTPEQRRAPVFRLGFDPGVACRANAALILWLLGYPEQALASIRAALTLAHELVHPYSLTYAHCMAAYIYQFRRHVLAVQEQAEAAVALATEQGFQLWVALGTILRGWTLAWQDQGEAGLAQVRQGIGAWHSTGATLLVPYYWSLLADVAVRLGRPEDGLQALSEAQALAEQHEERWWEAEIFRLRGVLLLQQSMTPQAEAETWFQRALDTARHQEAKSLELRAAMSLARLWQQQGKQAEARALLAPIYDWFTEGFDTPDLQEARALLEVLGD